MMPLYRQPLRSAAVLPSRGSAFRTLLVALALVPAGAAWAQHGHAANGYAGLQERTIKALSPEQIDDMKAGRGMGASLAAELNGVPGPLHVVELQERLGVTAAQKVALALISSDMTASARQLGQDILTAEATLDAAFKSGQATKPLIHEMTSRIGALQGQLRAVHLVAHQRTRGLLTDAQVAAYNQARGYTAPSGPAHSHHRH
jgi:hypothetical protein